MLTGTVRQYVQFAVGDEVLLLGPCGRCSPSDEWASLRSSCRVARTAACMYRLDIPATGRACDEFNVERSSLRPYLRRQDHLGGDAGLPSPVVTSRC